MAVLGRDYNSAINHLQNGLKLLHLVPVECREVTPVEIVQQSRKQEAHAKAWVVHDKVMAKLEA
jgi:putative transposase